MPGHPLLEPGRIIHFHVDFGPPSGVLPHFVILADCRDNHYFVFIIRSEPTEWQKTNAEARQHMVVIDKESHTFLAHDSLTNCGELTPIRMFSVVQHIREKPADVKCKISDDVCKTILATIEGSKLLSLDQKEGIKKYLGDM